MDRKPVWINDRQVFVLPWARGWDVLMAAPPVDFDDVWNGRATVADEYGTVVNLDGELCAGQRLFVIRKTRTKIRAAS